MDSSHVACNRRQARETQTHVSFDFAPYWLRKWPEI